MTLRGNCYIVTIYGLGDDIETVDARTLSVFYKVKFFLAIHLSLLIRYYMS